MVSCHARAKTSKLPNSDVALPLPDRLSTQIASRKANDSDPAGYPDSSNLLLESIRRERNARTKPLHILKEASRLHER